MTSLVKGKVGMAVLALSLAVAASAWPRAQTQTLEGTLGDVMCGLTHKMTDVSAAECTRGCVGMGSKYALIVGDDVYELEGGDAQQLNNLAGQKVKITGRVDGKKVQVQSITAA